MSPAYSVQLAANGTWSVIDEALDRPVEIRGIAQTGLDEGTAETLAYVLNKLADPGMPPTAH